MNYLYVYNYLFIAFSSYFPPTSLRRYFTEKEKKKLMPFSHEECEINWSDEMEFRINPSARGLLISNSKSISKQNSSLSL